MAAEPTATENLVAAGKAVHTTPATKRHQWPWLQVTWAAAAVGPGTLPLQCWGAHDPSLCPTIHSGGTHKPYKHKHGGGACAIPVPPPMHHSAHGVACVSGDPRQKERAHHPDGWQWLWKKQGSNNPGGTRSNMEARSHTSYRDGRGWKVPLSNIEAVQVREAKNLCDSATYQKTKERKLTLNLSFNFKWAGRGTIQATWRTTVTPYHKKKMTILQKLNFKSWNIAI